MRNRGFTYFDTVSPAEDGRPAAAFYAVRHRHSSESVWRGRLARGEAADAATGAPIAPDEPLRAGRRLAWRRPPWDEPDVPTDVRIVYDDGDLLAVDKPAGLPSVPDGGFLENTCVRLLRTRFPGEGPTPVHRLGRGTSGLLLFARTAAARRALCALFRDETAHADGRLEKRYRARSAPLSGARSGDRHDVRVPIGPVPQPPLGSVHAASPAGRPARSLCTVLRTDAAATLWDVAIETGRPHQIRIHLAALGCPLLGDPLFLPGGLPRPGVLPGACGYSLRAVFLRFPHPATGRPVELRVPDERP